MLAIKIKSTAWKKSLLCTRRVEGSWESNFIASKKKSTKKERASAFKIDGEKKKKKKDRKIRDMEGSEKVEWLPRRLPNWLGIN